MAGLVTTAVQVAVIHGDQVHVTEDEAVIGGILFQCLQEAYVEQLGPVEGVLAMLGLVQGTGQLWACDWQAPATLPLARVLPKGLLLPRIPLTPL